MENVIIEEKACSICETVKPLTDFYKQNKKSQDGTKWIYYNPECKECTKKRSTQWTNENREKARESNWKYKKTNRAKEKRKTVWMKNYIESGKRKEWVENNKDKLYEYTRERYQNKKHEITKKEWENCKNYFNYRCAYCGLKIEEHYIIYKGEKRLGDYHKDHVNHIGSNDLSNCAPACKACNVQKNTYTLDEWYDIKESFTYERLEKLKKWLNSDHIKYIEKKS